MNNSAIGQMIIGLRKLRDHNNTITKLLENQKKLCKLLTNVIMSNDSLAKQHYLHMLRQHNIKMIKREKVAKLIAQSATGTMYLVFTKFREHFSLMNQLNKMNKAQKERLVYKLKDCLESSIVGMQHKGFNALNEHNRMEKMKELIVKRLFGKVLGKNDAILSLGMGKLIENNHIRRTFHKCKSLYTAFEISERKISNIHALYFKMLKTFRRSNPWFFKMIQKLCHNSKVDTQISFWRIKDFRHCGVSLSAQKIVKIKKMFAIVNKHYELEIARSFWKIERFMDPDLTVNMSYLMSDHNRSYMNTSGMRMQESPERGGGGGGGDRKDQSPKKVRR